jgi:two-component system CheB/CheR fusion protein
VVFRVSDQGPGLASDAHETLFKRGHSLRSGGAGVGLSHSQHLAQQAGGQLAWIPSKSGAVFELRWPTCDAPSQTVQRSAMPASVVGMHVLLLEDDAAVMGMVQFGLEARGAVVHTASNLEELTALTNGSENFDAALVDFSPIQSDPKGALAALRAKKSNVPIILISGSAVAPDEDLPLTAWVHKPFELNELFAALQQVRERLGQRQSSP